MAWKLHTIEQTQLRRQHLVDGVGRPKLISTQVNATVMAYGQTGTGKTFTMLGAPAAVWAVASIGAGCMRSSHT